MTWRTCDECDTRIPTTRTRCDACRWWSKGYEAGAAATPQVITSWRDVQPALPMPEGAPVVWRSDGRWRAGEYRGGACVVAHGAELRILPSSLLLDLEQAHGFWVALCWAAERTVQLQGDEWPAGMLPMLRRHLTSRSTDGDRLMLANDCKVLASQEDAWDRYRAAHLGLGEPVSADEWLLLSRFAREREGFATLPADERIRIVRAHLVGVACG